MFATGGVALPATDGGLRPRSNMAGTPRNGGAVAFSPVPVPPADGRPISVARGIVVSPGNDTAGPGNGVASAPAHRAMIVTHRIRVPAASSTADGYANPSGHAQPVGVEAADHVWTGGILLCPYACR